MRLIVSGPKVLTASVGFVEIKPLRRASLNKLRNVFGARLAVVSAFPSFTWGSRNGFTPPPSQPLYWRWSASADMRHEIVHNSAVALEGPFTSRDLLRAQPFGRVIGDRLNTNRSVTAQLANLVENFPRLFFGEVARCLPCRPLP